MAVAGEEGAERSMARCKGEDIARGTLEDTRLYCLLQC